MARPVLLLLLCVLSTLTTPSQAQSNDTVSIYEPEDTFEYHGCFNETTEISDSGPRALSGGITEVREDEMTVSVCLDLCSEGDQEYEYAGLQWARECWCANTLSEVAEKLDDGECDFACEGDRDIACGGRLKLSDYKRSGAQALRLSAWAITLSSLAIFAYT